MFSASLRTFPLIKEVPQIAITNSYSTTPIANTSFCNSDIPVLLTGSALLCIN